MYFAIHLCIIVMIDGDFNETCGVCIDMEGFMYVCFDYNNHRIQCFKFIAIMMSISMPH